MSDLERKLLARCIDPEAVAEAWDAGVRGELFEEPLYEAIWTFTVDYWQKSQLKAAPTPWALTQEYPGYTVTDDATEETGYLADLLRRRYVTNQLQDMLRDGAADSVRDPIGALKTLHARAFEASEAVARRVTRTNMADTIEEDRADYDRAEAFPQGLGVPYGLDLVDLHTGGLLPGELAVIGAYAKTGKTMFGLWAMTQALRQGYRPMVFTLEMGLKEIRVRIAAMYSGVSYDRLSHKRLSTEEKDRLWAAREEIRTLGDIAIERPDEGDRTVASMMSRARQYGADYVFIDQLSFMEAGVRTQTKKEQYAAILKALKVDITRAGMEIPCLLAVQFRREDGEPTLQSFADAAEVERDVDIALGLWRNRDLYHNRQMRFDILGSRRSPSASWLLDWRLSEETRFTVSKEIEA